MDINYKITVIEKIKNNPHLSKFDVSWLTKAIEQYASEEECENVFKEYGYKRSPFYDDGATDWELQEVIKKLIPRKTLMRIARELAGRAPTNKDKRLQRAQQRALAERAADRYELLNELTTYRLSGHLYIMGWRIY